MFWYVVLSAVIVGAVAQLLRNVFTPGLYDLPGPWICKFSNAYRTYRGWRGDASIWFQELKEQYGDLVRIGPNVVLNSEPDEFQKVFGFKEDYTKSESMEVWRSVVNGQAIESIANTRSKVIHTKLKRPVATLYSNTNVVSYHPRVAQTIKYFIKRLDEEFIQGANANRKCDIDNWLQYFAFDIVGELTISRRMGFLENGKDVDGMLDDLHDEFEYRGTFQNMPLLDKFLRKNPLYLYFKSPTSKFSAKAKMLAVQRLKDEKHDGVDMLEGFLEAQKKHSEVVTPNVVNMYVGTNLLAGSDTTSVTLRSIIWFVLKTPGVLEKLREEIDEQVMEFPPDYNTALGMKYLDAVIRESLRMHPIMNIVLERNIPAEGHTTPSGRTLPPGSITAHSPWTINFNEEVWGPQPREFKPERWLKYDDETLDAYEQRLNRMKHNDFSFSWGPRICIGKHIAWLEIIEVIPTLFGLLDIKFADPNKKWRVKGAFFTRQYDMDVTLKWRQGADKTQILN